MNYGNVGSPGTGRKGCGPACAPLRTMRPRREEPHGSGTGQPRARGAPPQATDRRCGRRDRRSRGRRRGSGTDSACIRARCGRHRGPAGAPPRAARMPRLRESPPGPARPARRSPCPARPAPRHPAHSVRRCGGTARRRGCAPWPARRRCGCGFRGRRVSPPAPCPRWAARRISGAGSRSPRPWPYCRPRRPACTPAPPAPRRTRRPDAAPPRPGGSRRDSSCRRRDRSATRGAAGGGFRATP